MFNATGLLAAGFGDGIVRLVTPDGTVRAQQAHDGAVLVVATDVDGRGFLTGGDDGRLVRTTVDGASAVLLSVPGRQIDVLAASAPARACAVAIGREVRLLDGTGAERARAADHPSSISGLAFNPKGKRLAISHYGGVTLWWVATLGRTAPGHTPKRLSWAGSHIGVSWSPSGEYLLTATQERELHGWRVIDGEDMSMRGYAAKVRSIAWAARPPLLVTSGADCVVCWPFSGAGPQGKPPLEVGAGLGTLVTQVAVHPSRLLVAAGFDDGSVAVCELAPGRDDRAVRLRRADGSRVTALAWSPDGRLLAAGTGTGTLATFDLSTPAA